MSAFGIKGNYEHHRYEDEAQRQYEPRFAERFFDVLLEIHRIFNKHRADLSGTVGPVQFWPHGFDLSFEWFGNRMIRHEDGGEIVEHPSQLNLGFSPGSESTEPYFYSNPWPFAGEQLTSHPLPHEASWHTERWEGTVLPYSLLMDEADAETILLEYAMAVFDIAEPTLME